MSWYREPKPPRENTLIYERAVHQFLKPEKQAPLLYLKLANDLIATRQTARPGPAIPLRASPQLARNQHVFEDPSERPLGRVAYFPFTCPMCGRHGRHLANRRVLRPVCSPACDLAQRLFLHDVWAITGQTFSHNRHPWPRDIIETLYSVEYLSDPRNIVRTTTPPHELRISEKLRRSVIVGDFAVTRGAHYLSSLLVPPSILITILRRLMSDEKNPHIIPQMTAPGSPSAFSSPVLRAATDVVLENLHTANDILKATKNHKDAPQWTHEQVKLFLGLYSRVTPAISASLNLNADFPRSPSEMTNEELQAAAAARRAKIESGKIKRGELAPPTPLEEDDSE